MEVINTHRSVRVTQEPRRRSLDAKFHDRSPAASLVLRGFGDGDDVRMLLKVLAEGFAQDAHPAAVDDANTRQSGKESAVDKFFDFGGGFVDGASNDIDFRGDA